MQTNCKLAMAIQTPGADLAGRFTGMLLLVAAVAARPAPEPCSMAGFAAWLGLQLTG